jgi:hypothetical protein
MTKTELHELVDGLPDDTLNGAAVLLRSLTERRIDPDQMVLDAGLACWRA